MCSAAEPGAAATSRASTVPVRGPDSSRPSANSPQAAAMPATVVTSIAAHHGDGPTAITDAISAG